MAVSDTIRRALTSYALYVALGVVVGWVAAPVFAGAVQSDQPEPVVAVVPIEGTIDGATASRVSATLSEVRSNDSIAAVVLAANSGGGQAAASEQLYFSVKRTAESGVPVTASVGAAAASGAYYAVAPADRIYVKPSSTVGSVGVVAQLPDDVEPNDLIGASGSNKLQGADTREFLYIIDSLQTAFVNSVLEQRGDELELSRSELEQARIYSGGQAVRNGLADRVGDRTAAIHEAAERAGLDSYRVRVLDPQNGSVTFVSRSAYLASDAETKRLLPAERLLGNGTGGPTFLMTGTAYLTGTEDAVTAAALDRHRSNATGTDGTAITDPGRDDPAADPRIDASRTGALGAVPSTGPPPGIAAPDPSSQDPGTWRTVSPRVPAEGLVDPLARPATGGGSP